MADERQAGRIGKCSVCGEERMLFYESTSESNTALDRFYCQECYDYSKEEITCPHCGKIIAREYKAKHISDMHPV
jgi:ribosomal protein S27E